MTDETTVIREKWPYILEAIKNRRRFTWILASQNAKVLSYDSTTLRLGFINQGALDNFVVSDSCTVIEGALAEVLGTKPVLELVLETSTPAAPARTESEGPTAHVQGSVTASNATTGPTPAAMPLLHIVLAQTAFLMHEQGNLQAAALLADVDDVELVPDNCFEDWQDAVLIMPPYLVPRFTEEAISAIQPVFEHVAGRHGLEIGSITAAPGLPGIGDDWRQILQERLAAGETANRTSRIRTRTVAPAFRRDGFVFDSREEVLVYEALKREQAVLPKESTIAIFPLPMGRVGSGNSRTPDFLVTAAGRVGIIEVDRPHHRGRFGVDSTCDRHWRNSGIVHIERILVEETSVDAELDLLVRPFLTRLREYR